MTEPLSSSKNLFKLPRVLYTHTCIVDIIFCIFSRPFFVSVAFKSTNNFINIIVNTLTSLHQFSCSISKYPVIAAGTKVRKILALFANFSWLNLVRIKRASALVCNFLYFLSKSPIYK